MDGIEHEVELSIDETRERTNAIMWGFLEEVVLMMDTKAMLSVWNSMVLLESKVPQRCADKTMG